MRRAINCGMDCVAPAAREVNAAKRSLTWARAWAGDDEVPEPAVSSFAVVSVVFRKLRNSSLFKENIVRKVSLSISSTRAASPSIPSTLRVRESVRPSEKIRLPLRSASAGL